MILNRWRLDVMPNLLATYIAFMPAVRQSSPLAFDPHESSQRAWYPKLAPRAFGSE